MSADPVLLVERRGPVSWLTLNRPSKHNALNSALVEALSESLDQLAEDPETRVIVLTGAGERAFSAGFDLSEEVASDLSTAAKWRSFLERDVQATMKLWSLPKPTIAAVNGWCLAGGLELALACDVIVASASSQLGEPEIRYGSGPVTLLLPFVVGQRIARELLLTGDVISAERAHAVGLVNHVVEANELEDLVSRLAERIAPTPPGVLQMTKAALTAAYDEMGLRAAVMANLDNSAILNSAMEPEQEEFDRLAREEGLRDALEWRDRRYKQVLGTQL